MICFNEFLVTREIKSALLKSYSAWEGALQQKKIGFLGFAFCLLIPYRDMHSCVPC